MPRSSARSTPPRRPVCRSRDSPRRLTPTFSSPGSPSRTFARTGASLFHRDVARRVGHALRPGAPARVHAIRNAVEQGFDLVDLAFLDLEELRDLPGPRLHRACGDFSAVRRLEVARGAARMVEEAKREHDAAFLVDGNVTSVAD